MLDTSTIGTQANLVSACFWLVFNCCNTSSCFCCFFLPGFFAQGNHTFQDLQVSSSTRKSPNFTRFVHRKSPSPSTRPGQRFRHRCRHVSAAAPGVTHRHQARQGRPSPRRKQRCVAATVGGHGFGSGAQGGALPHGRWLLLDLSKGQVPKLLQLPEKLQSKPWNMEDNFQTTGEEDPSSEKKDLWER